MEQTMEHQIQNNLSGAVIFLEEHCEGEYNIKNNRIVYNRNLRLPDIDGISNMNLSAIQVEGIVMISSSKTFRLEYLPYAEGYYGLTPDKITSNKKITRKRFEEKGFSRQFCREYKKMQFMDFCDKIKNKVRNMSHTFISKQIDA